MAADALHHRPAGPEDEEIVFMLMREFYTEEHLVFDELLTLRAVRELIAQPALGLIILLESAGTVAGYFTLTFGFSLEFHGRFALLDELYLIPSARGRGWGKHCLTLAADTARARDVATLRLEVNHANARARSVYLKAGFQDNQRDIFTQWLR
ncbi:GNAT family N-acetyltransferase [Rariglobus hedericola]|uniref:GNAT family N-acetyltransferase n=1 Tax=Rariglobus hedericola TaxID=2597822 RepID=A0A556QR78_9BACT|nr:GNAT family N-acetyltransferase [Rariglobus hedericola]TSJ79141.1 GNAT family N-acetyltransferase [Rariglobus hedericola]